ncbi:type IV pilin protein [Sphaerotilaceae bacterium SBD11-9]
MSNSIHLPRQRAMTNHTGIRGFTLIEVMIVVAIVGILAAIAYPSYLEQVARSRRADAKAALLDRAQWMERQYSVSGRYDRTGAGDALDVDKLPALSGATAAHYAQSFASGPTQTTYVLQMAPTASGAMASDRCGSFRVSQTGAKTITGSADSSSCWDK